MKKLIILALAAILVFGLLAGCSANGYLDTPGERGNVSTTRDGRVNGTNNYKSYTAPNTQRTTTKKNTDRFGVEGHIDVGRTA